MSCWLRARSAGWRNATTQFALWPGGRRQCDAGAARPARLRQDRRTRGGAVSALWKTRHPGRQRRAVRHLYADAARHAAGMGRGSRPRPDRQLAADPGDGPAVAHGPSRARDLCHEPAGARRAALLRGLRCRQGRSGNDGAHLCRRGRAHRDTCQPDRSGHCPHPAARRDLSRRGPCRAPRPGGRHRRFCRACFPRMHPQRRYREIGGG